MRKALCPLLFPASVHLRKSAVKFLKNQSSNPPKIKAFLKIREHIFVNKLA